MKRTQKQAAATVEVKQLRADVAQLQQQMRALIFRDQLDRLMARVAALEALQD